MPEQKMPELLPCPFCGGAADCDMTYPNGNEYHVSCKTDDICPGDIAIPNLSYSTPLQAITAWNTRSDLAAADGPQTTECAACGAELQVYSNPGGDIAGNIALSESVDAELLREAVDAYSDYEHEEAYLRKTEMHDNYTDRARSRNRQALALKKLLDSVAAILAAHPEWKDGGR